MSQTVTAPELALLPFGARGPLSDAVMRHAVGASEGADHTELARRVVSRSSDVVRDDDIQLALFVLYACAYGSLPGLKARLEWDTDLIATRRMLEDAFEQELRAVVTTPETPAADAGAIAAALFELTAPSPGPSIARFIARKATKEQVREMFVLRSIYTLREADPHSWALPRLSGRPKAALVEIQADEYGGGRPERMHATLFASAMRGAGLDDTYGTYVDYVPALVLASHNTMSMFGMNRRLLGAIVGHLAAFEMTSSLPSRMWADGLRRLGFPEDVTEYYDEHVEADAVHEQIAGHDLAGSLGEDRPELIGDIMFGAAACLALDEWLGHDVLEAWSVGDSILERELRS